MRLTFQEHAEFTIRQTHMNDLILAKVEFGICGYIENCSSAAHCGHFLWKGPV